MEPQAQFINLLSDSIAKKSFVKLTLSKPTKSNLLKNVFVRPVVIRDISMLGFTFRYPERDEVKNYLPTEIAQQLGGMLGNEFLKADLFTLSQNVSLLYSKKRKAKLLTQAASHDAPPSQAHDRQKNRLLEAQGQTYLHELGITDKNGQVLKSSQKKYRQINKYIEIVDSLLKQHPLPENPHIVDMGSGKGYLTFALFDYLSHVLKLNPTLVGIELRSKLVNFCNQLAQKEEYKNLHFVSTDISEYQSERIDLLIALHACDIATDLAIAKGIAAEAELIMVAPCCHKQIRRQMSCQTDMQAILRHGILEERQAELITDGIRALLLEYKGYQTKVFQFIETEHTPKNVLIVGMKAKPNPAALEQVKSIKQDFGIDYHYLEKLLGIV